MKSEKAVAPHSSTLAWKTPWTEKPGRLQSMGSLRVGHDWVASFSLSCIGEGNGNPLQCSCLENPRDGGAWWAAVSGVAQNRTWLKRLSSSSSSSSSIIWNVTHTPKKQQLEVITFQVLVFCLFEWPKPLFQKDLSFQWSCFSFDCWCFPLSLTTGHESSKRLQTQYSLLPLYESNPISSCYSRSITPANRFFILPCWFDG